MEVNNKSIRISRFLPLQEEEGERETVALFTTQARLMETNIDLEYTDT